ncbi:relaxase/mobilization nuclease domain-containing protein, partial [Mucilaginibacter sp. 5C4]
MIAIQKIGKSFMGAFSYNVKKMAHPNKRLRAEILGTNFSSLDALQVRKEVELLRSLKPNLNRYVYHTSLNFSKDETLDNKTLVNIANDYLKEQGFTNNQYMIFRHHDADHPHIHLLVNRISFDGSVVSDSNNYKKSEAIIRKLEQQYKLVSVEPSSSVQKKAPTKDEIEMITRTGKASERMVLQELMNSLLKKPGLTLRDMIAQGEKMGINFLFNQATTGKVSGISYYHNGFKAKGQALGNRYKWAGLIKVINYEQVRDSAAISEANSWATAKYGDQTSAGTYTAAEEQPRSGTGLVSPNAGAGV